MGKRYRQRVRKTGKEEEGGKELEEEEEEGKKRGVVSPCVQAGAAH